MECFRPKLLSGLKSHETVQSLYFTMCSASRLNLGHSKDLALTAIAGTVLKSARPEDSKHPLPITNKNENLWNFRRGVSSGPGRSISTGLH